MCTSLQRKGRAGRTFFPEGKKSMLKGWEGSYFQETAHAKRREEEGNFLILDLRYMWKPQ
jgi:hypothetical protein